MVVVGVLAVVVSVVATVVLASSSSSASGVAVVALVGLWLCGVKILSTCETVPRDDTNLPPPRSTTVCESVSVSILVACGFG